MKRRDFLAASAGLAGSVLPGFARAQSKPCPEPTLTSGSQTVTTTCTSVTAAQDWQSRISGPGVVWYHPFASANEVNNFRWTPGYQSGCDPLAKGNSISSSCPWLNTTDGPAPGFYCMEFVRPAGTNDGSHWWRPMSPIVGGTTTGNGRGVGNSDPGANGTITPQAFNVSDGSGTTNAWSNGYYANSTYAATMGSAYDSNEFYFQARVKIDPNRANVENQVIDGKLFYHTLASMSDTLQEMVTVSWEGPSASVPTGHDYFSTYRSQGVYEFVCQYLRDTSWQWPLGQWATILYHFKPGTTPSLGSTTGNADTVFEVWVANAGQTGYTQIFSSTTVPMPFQTQYGYNAIIASIYQQGYNMSAFYHRFGQFIFSKSFIPCPQV